VHCCYGRRSGRCNNDKYSVMHLENNKQDASYGFGGEVLNRTKEEKDLVLSRPNCY